MKGKNYKKEYFHPNVKYIQPKYNWAQGIIASGGMEAEDVVVVFDYYRHFEHCYYADMLGLPEPNKENYMYVVNRDKIGKDKADRDVRPPNKTPLALDNILGEFDRMFGMENVE